MRLRVCAVFLFVAVLATGQTSKPVELSQEPHYKELLKNDAVRVWLLELAPQQARNIGLADADQRRRFCLGYFLSAYDLLEARDQLRLEQMRLRVGNLQVSEHIAAAALGRCFTRHGCSVLDAIPRPPLTFAAPVQCPISPS